MKLKKGIPLIDQHDQHGFWGGKFGGSFIPETLKKPVEDLTNEFKKLRKDKKFLKKRDFYFKNYIGTPTSFVKLDNLTNHLGGAQIWAKVVSEANGGAHKIYNATVHALICKTMGKKYIYFGFIFYPRSLKTPRYIYNICYFFIIIKIIIYLNVARYH